MSKPVSRRKFIKLGVTSAAGLILGACAPAAATPQVIEKEVTRVVEVEGTPVVQTAIVKEVVTSTPAPTQAPANMLAASRTAARTSTWPWW